MSKLNLNRYSGRFTIIGVILVVVTVISLTASVVTTKFYLEKMIFSTDKSYPIHGIQKVPEEESHPINETIRNVQTRSEEHLDERESKVANNETELLATSAETIKSLQAENEDLLKKLNNLKEEQKDGTKKSISNYNCTKPKKKCALLFFGIIQSEFRPLILPSIERNILSINPDCDVFVHTYNITTIPHNKRSGEFSNAVTHPEDSYLLAKDHDHVQMDTVAEFWDRRGELVNFTKEFHCKSWGECCDSHINMIKQWHSIKGVWDVMRHHETLLLNKNDHGHDNADDNRIHYEQIGLFRSDVYYPAPISIYEHAPGIPDFGHFGGLNDRLFYGNRQHAQLWADRFAFQKVFHEKYLTKREGYHSETYVKNLLDHHDIKVERNDNICVWRMRSGWRVRSDDCEAIGADPDAHLPIGYKLVDRDTNMQKVVIDAIHSSGNASMGNIENKAKWLFDPILDSRRTLLLETFCHTNTTHP